MSTIQLLNDELERTVVNTELVLDDLTITNNLINAIKLITGSIEAIKTKTNDVTNVSNDLYKFAVVLSKFPYIGTIGTAAKYTIKKINYSSSKTEELMTNVSPALTTLNGILTVLSVGVSASHLLVDKAKSEAEDWLLSTEALVGEGVINPTSGLSGSDLDFYLRLKNHNDDSTQLLADTASYRENLAFLTTDWLSLVGIINLVGSAYDDIFNALNTLSPVLDEFSKALKPIEWALDAAEEVQRQVIDPVINALLEATGLDQVLDGLLGGLTLDQAILGDFTDALEKLKVDLNLDIGAMVTNYWDIAEVSFGVTGPFDLMLNDGPIEIKDTDGSLRIIGTSRDDVLDGTAFNDHFISGKGNDIINGDLGTDTAWFMQSLESYLLKNNSGQVTINWRDVNHEDEGNDTANSVELFRFNNVGLGDVTLSDINLFQYTASGTANLTGTADDNWLIGDNQVNILEGDAGSDHLFGGGNNDTLDGGAGDDWLYGGDGNDRLIVSLGSDQLFGGDGIDTADLNARSSGVTVDFDNNAIDYGVDGATHMESIEIVKGSTHDDIYYGSSNVDTAITNGGNDQFLYAGTGDIVNNDGNGDGTRDGSVSVSFLGGDYQGVRIEQHVDSSISSSVLTYHNNLLGYTSGAKGSPKLTAVNKIAGTAYADVFYALGVTLDAVPATSYNYDFEQDGSITPLILTGSVYYGGDGTDVFFGSEFSNLFVGGAGYDLVNYSFDYAIEMGASSARVFKSLNINLNTGEVTQNGNDGIDFAADRLVGIEGVVGTDGDDIIYGNDDANYLNGDRGHDEIYGGGGDDYIDASYSIGSTLFGDAGNDIFVLGPAENALIDGGTGVDTVEALPDQAFRLDVYQDDLAFVAQSGELHAISGWTINLADGTTSADFYDDTWNPSAGNIPYTYGATLTSIENAFGANLDDDITGSDADNLLVGRDGNDILTGGKGNDSLVGGDGNDWYKYTKGDGHDIISDIDDTGSIDIIWLYGDFGLLDADVSYSREGNDLLINFAGSDTDSITIQGQFIEGLASRVERIIINDGNSAVLPDFNSLINNAPIAENDTFSVDEDNQLQGNLLADNGAGLDSDPDNDVLTVLAEIVTTSSGGGVTILENGGFTYTPLVNYYGIDTFSYTVQDSYGSTTTGTAEITVNSINDSPIANNDLFSVDEDNQLQGNLLVDNGAGLDSDIDNDLLTVGTEAVTTTSGGEVTILASGDFTYTPLANYYGVDTFSYTLQDPYGETATAGVEITVNSINDAPIAKNDLFSVDEDNQLQGNVLADNGAGLDSEPENDLLTVLAETTNSASGGEVAILANGDFTYTPLANYYGIDIFSYTLQDSNGSTATATVEITVNSVYDAPPPPTTETDETTEIVDGVEVVRVTVSSNLTELEIVTTVIEPTSQTEGDNNELADIPLLFDSENPEQVMTEVSLPAGVGLTATGVITPITQTDALLELIYLIQTVSHKHNESNVERLSGAGQDFLDTLADDAEILVHQITLTTNFTSISQIPIVIAGNIDGAVEALVIDASQLPQGTVIELVDVDFAIIIGEVTLRGGAGSNIVYAGEGSQNIVLGADDDVLHGGAGDDIIGSEGGDDQLFGNSGDDILFGGLGNDFMHGGLDNDVVQYSGNRVDYEIIQDQSRITVRSLLDETDTDVLVNIESIEFADETLLVEYETDNTMIAALYQQVFSRQADLDGFQWWADKLSSGVSAGDVALRFATIKAQQEGLDLFSLKNAEVINLYYDYFLSREGDTPGVAHWIGELNRGVTLNEVANGFVTSIELQGQYIAPEGWEFFQ